MKNALLAAEDRRFFSHSGFDPFGIVRAAWKDLRDRRRGQGASTLSMQLANFLRFRNGRLIEFREFANTFDLVEQALGRPIHLPPPRRAKTAARS